MSFCHSFDKNSPPSSCNIEVIKLSEQKESCATGPIDAQSHSSEEKSMPASSVCSLYTMKNLFSRPREDVSGDEKISSGKVSNQRTNENNESDESNTHPTNYVNLQHRLIGLQARYKKAQIKANRTIASLQSQVSAKAALNNSLEERNNCLRKQVASKTNDLQRTMTQLTKSRTEIEIMMTKLTYNEHRLEIVSQEREKIQTKYQQMQMESLQYKAKNQVIQAHENDSFSKLEATEKELVETRLQLNRIHSRFKLGEAKLHQVNQELHQCKAMNCATIHVWKNRLQVAREAACQSSKKALHQERKNSLLANERHKEEYARVCTRLSKLENTLQRKDEVILMLESRCETDTLERLRLSESVERLANAEKLWIKQIEIVEVELWREKKAKNNRSARTHHSTQTDTGTCGSCCDEKVHVIDQGTTFHTQQLISQLNELEEDNVRLRSLHTIEIQAQQKAYDELFGAYRRKTESEIQS